jgi:hypothetical protein
MPICVQESNQGHDIMQQTERHPLLNFLSFPDAPLVDQLHDTCTIILAPASLIGSEYDTGLPIAMSIDLPPPLISRFDSLHRNVRSH